MVADIAAAEAWPPSLKSYCERRPLDSPQTWGIPFIYMSKEATQNYL